jgi:hypothetical protein
MAKELDARTLRAVARQMRKELPGWRRTERFARGLHVYTTALEAAYWQKALGVTADKLTEQAETIERKKARRRG